MLDPRLLRSFVVLAEDLHFGRAAERLNLAQPALSQQIRRLERQVGVDLYTRSSRIVELTDAGRAMLEPARAALRAAAHAERAAQEAARSSVHTLRAGVEMSLEDMVPTVLAARGGAWFRAGGAELHLGVDDDFRPARKGHPGVLVDDLDEVIARLAAAGQPVTRDSDFPGFRRVYAHDPFGNRLEFLEPCP